MYYFCGQSLSAKARNGGHPVFKMFRWAGIGFFFSAKNLARDSKKVDLKVWAAVTTTNKYFQFLYWSPVKTRTQGPLSRVDPERVYDGMGQINEIML